MTYSNSKCTALYNSLKEMQSEVIGLFRPRFSSQYEPVFSRDENGMLETLDVGRLLGLSTLTIHESAGRYVPFLVHKNSSSTDCKSYQTLSEMLCEPFIFTNWYEYFVTGGHNVYTEIYPENCKYPLNN